MSGIADAGYIRLPHTRCHMPDGNRYKTYIYHLTSVQNLPSICEHGLLPRRELIQRGFVFEDVADGGILNGRAQFGLDDMVPFHFIPKSPFDYAVVRNRPSEHFALLAVRRDHASTQGWKIIPRHPLTASEAPDILDWEQGMSRIDWAQMDRKPRPYDTDHECKMVCMAEALSPQTVTLNQIAAIYIPSDETKIQVERIIKPHSTMWVNTNPGMFPKVRR